MRPFINRVRCHARLFALAFLSSLALLSLAGCSASDPAWKAALVAVNAIRDAREAVCSEPVSSAINAVERGIPRVDAAVSAKDAASDSDADSDAESDMGSDALVLPVTMPEGDAGVNK
jgi:hypothetical protein